MSTGTAKVRQKVDAQQANLNMPALLKPAGWLVSTLPH
jgi:hypothetical protein